MQRRHSRRKARTARLGGSGAGRRAPRKRTPGVRGAAPSRCSAGTAGARRAQRASAGAARGCGAPASGRRGFGAKPRLDAAPAAPALHQTGPCPRTAGVRWRGTAQPLEDDGLEFAEAAEHQVGRRQHVGRVAVRDRGAGQPGGLGGGDAPHRILDGEVGRRLQARRAAVQQLHRPEVRIGRRASSAPRRRPRQSRGSAGGRSRRPESPRSRDGARPTRCRAGAPRPAAGCRRPRPETGRRRRGPAPRSGAPSPRRARGPRRP